MSEANFSDAFDAMSRGYLEHHGVKGMKWGVRRTPEQLGYKTSSKRKKSSILAKLAKNSKKKAAKAKKTQEQKKEESREEIRAKLLKSTDPKYISKHMDLLDTKELQERIDRITKETTMKKLASSKDSDKVKKGENALKSIASMAESVSKIADAYNKVSDVKNKSSERAKKEAEAKNKEKEQKAQNEAKKKEAQEFEQLKNRMEQERKALAAEESKKRSTAINKALKDLDESGDIEKISPTKLMSSIDAANKAYDTIKTFSDVEIAFDPTTGDIKFKKKKS